ncbi:looped-hinge helix DNA binding domain, AbrB family (transcriptional regulator) [Methanocella conradii HZ254]|uniref:Looped-hinge helix DNA binding domain, AbrB family (Transcriptional regulator) n=1 Tax=Methanocella conradii (strain DSM 24694 / JCM 17849 / CGMCC 1.5162 / HZ254) TaxID=1041930 RepID=H8IAX1_METCZ|nr:AbrB/MazE/SpoVT family DNA-binding domain-containing protein [Methanocella conradii]AFD00981.1 looped-hinge helix DNA binding domain, AbrB family (transcriptional regulator) [Methanocella conradii HZ254]MDI6897670.1 AbrB/MazE/SpoVT family DNA-binding domain-containing protein [Methanocella conradii]
MEPCSSKVSSQNQITLPADVRNKIGVGPGDKVVFIEEDDKVVLRSLKDMIYEMAEGFKDFDKTDKEFREGWAKRLKREGIV